MSSFPIKIIIEDDEDSGKKRTGDEKFFYGSFTFNTKNIIITETFYEKLIAQQDNDDEIPELEHITTDDEMSELEHNIKEFNNMGFLPEQEVKEEKFGEEKQTYVETNMEEIEIKLQEKNES